MDSIINTKWPTSKIRDLCDVSRGASPRPIADQKYFEGGHIPWIKIADATKSGKYLYETKQYVNDYGASFSKILPAGTIIVAASGTLGYTQILGVSGCAHDGWLILTNLKNFNKDYAYYVLQQMQKHFYNSAYGAAIQNINTEILKETIIPCPPLQVQHKIAAILSAYDDLIENNLRRIRILEEMAQNLYREWFVNFRFPGHENTRFVDSPLGQIPEGWEVVKIGDLLGKIKRVTKVPKSSYKVDGLYPVIDQGKDFIGGYTDHEESIISNDLPLIVFGDHTRVLKYIDFPFARGADGTQLLKSNNKRMPMSLFYYSLLAIDLSSYAYARHFKFLKDEKILLPDSTTAKAIDKLLAPKLDNIKMLMKKNGKLRQTRDLLLPKLISGEVDVSELDIKVPEEVAI